MAQKTIIFVSINHSWQLDGEPLSHSLHKLTNIYTWYSNNMCCVPNNTLYRISVRKSNEREITNICATHKPRMYLFNVLHNTDYKPSETYIIIMDFLLYWTPIQTSIYTQLYGVETCFWLVFFNEQVHSPCPLPVDWLLFEI